MINWQGYNKAELRSFAIQTYREGEGSRPDVFLLEKDGEQVVLKDHDGMDAAYARFIGPLLVWREVKAMRRLKHLSGVPKFIFCPDKRSLLMEHIEARQVVNVNKSEYDAIHYFQNLKDIIEQMHQQGIAHGDLRSPTNALIDANGGAVLVDFVASLGRGSTWNILNRYLFNKMCLVDLSAVTKLKKRIAPQLLDETDLDSMDIAGKKGMIFRAFGQLIRTLSRKLFTNK